MKLNYETIAKWLTANVTTWPHDLVWPLTSWPLSSFSTSMYNLSDVTIQLVH